MGAVAAAPPIQTSLDFEIGTGFKQAPEQSTFNVSGSLASVKHELMADAKVTVQVLDENGEVIVRSSGKVTGIGFKKHTPANERAWVERLHTIKLGADS